MASEDALGGSSGVLASEDSSASEPGDAGLLSTCSSGVGGTDESGESDIVGNSWRATTQEVYLQRFGERGYLVVCGMRLLGSVEMALQVVDMCLLLNRRDLGSQASGRGAERFKIGNARANFGSFDRMSRQWRRRGNQGTR